MLKKNPTSMVARWFIAMQELHFTVEFVPGTSNVLADALSRLILVHYTDEFLQIKGDLTSN